MSEKPAGGAFLLDAWRIAGIFLTVLNDRDKDGVFYFCSLSFSFGFLGAMCRWMCSCGGVTFSVIFLSLPQRR